MLLYAIISQHTRSGEPIGSGSLLSSFNISSATIRNEMAALTELGLLEQPHTSAGRVPTAEGYRYYVDNLMRAFPLSDRERSRIHSAISSMDTDPDKAAKEAARELSDMTGLAAFSASASGAEAHIVHYELIRVGRYNTALLGVTGSGAVKSRVVRSERELSEKELLQIEESLNGRAVFISAEDANVELIGGIRADLGDSADPFIKGALTLIAEASRVHVYTTGQQTLLKYRELDGYMKQLLDIFSDTRFLIKCFDGVREPVAVYVGDESRMGLPAVSMVLARYFASGGMSGGLGVVGPVRMNYEYIIPRLEFFCEELSAALTNA